MFVKVKWQPSAQLLSEFAGPPDVNRLPLGHGNEIGQEQAGGWQGGDIPAPHAWDTWLGLQNEKRRQHAEAVLNQGTRSTVWVGYCFNESTVCLDGPGFLATLESSPEQRQAGPLGKRYLQPADAFLPGLPDFSAFQLELLASLAKF